MGAALQTALGHHYARHLAAAADAAAAAAAPAVTPQMWNAAVIEAAGCLQTAGRLLGAGLPSLGVAALDPSAAGWEAAGAVAGHQTRGPALLPWHAAERQAAQ